MTPAELLKQKMKGSWGRFSEDELYKVFCLLIEQIDVLEKQNKSLKKEVRALHDSSEARIQNELEQIELIKTHAKLDAIKIIDETEKISKVIIGQAIEDVEKVMEETERFETRHLEVKDELIDFLQLKIDDIKKCWRKC